MSAQDDRPDLPQRAFIPLQLPTSEPTDGEQVTVCFAAEYLPIVEGALLPLTAPEMWDTTDEDAALLAGDRIARLTAKIDEQDCAVGGDIQTPFWDDATDVDDSEEPAMQTWYGAVSDAEADYAELDFVENLAVWAFTGLLAVGAGAGAAILFHTIAPRFVLAMRGGDFAEVIRVILDGEDMAYIDTTDRAGEIIRVPIVGDPDIETHELYIIQVS
jgi:hypothetical protein